MLDKRRMKMSRQSADRLRFFVVGTCYCLSAGVLILQLLAFNGSQLAYALFFVLHASAFWLVVLRANGASPLGRSLLLVGGALAVGAIPFRPAFMAVAALLGGSEYHFSSLTWDMPIVIRAVYEVGFFPCLQFALIYAALRYWPVAQERVAGGDIAS